SQYGLASIGEQIFQVNSDLFERGRQMAFYAIDSLGMKTFAALAPADDYGREMVAGFMAGVQKNNGIFIGPPKWYYHGSKDLSRQIRAVRALGFEYLKKDSTWARRNALLLARSHIDSGAVAITSIDGLFCPVYTEDIQYIGPQCANLQIRTRLLGGDYWFDADALSANQSYINGVVFVSDYYVDEYNPDYRRFRAQFRIKTGKDFGRLEAFGYDTMKALLKVIQENNVTNRQMLIEKVNTLNAFKGIKSDISWKGNARVNADVNILEYNGGLLKKLR
ncbi:ABC transporter substrate-binding protein, partial [candidate division KSB1 bacterium]|nr:ABC transporter substrate-binding protein [candidate division KSB1 bacterium]